MLELRQAHPRLQGDIGEAAAIAWLTRSGFGVWIPLGHSPDADLIAQRDDRLLRIQVKTSTAFRNGRFEVTLATKGGNRSGSGRIKPIDARRYEYLFVLVTDGRQWFIPATEITAKTVLLLGGPKYAHFEVDSATRSSVGAGPSSANAAPDSRAAVTSLQLHREQGNAQASTNPRPRARYHAPCSEP